MYVDDGTRWVDRHGLIWSWSPIWGAYRSAGSGMPAHGIDTLRTERGPLLRYAPVKICKCGHEEEKHMYGWNSCFGSHCRCRRYIGQEVSR